MKPTLSLAMIVRDSEATLDRCLKSFAPVVDEVIIVDTGSKDRTLEIAAKYTDKIFFFDWIDDFAAARNYSFDMCTGDFIVWADSDDELTPEEATKIKALDLSDKEVIICHYQYAHDEFGKCTLPVPRERIIKRSLGLKWVGEIHECIPLGEAKQFISDLNFPKHHKHGTSSERNIRILEKALEKDPISSRTVYYLGKEYIDYNMGRHPINETYRDRGIHHLERFTTMPGSFWEDVYHAHDMIAQAKLSKGDDAGFLTHIYKSIQIEDRRAEPFYHLAFFFHMKGQTDRAIQWYEHCLDVRRPTGLLSAYQPEYYSWLPHLQLCVCYNAIGEIQKAFDHNSKVLENRPNDPRAKSNAIILKDALNQKKADKTNGAGKRLHLGCGGKHLEGYVNVDIFKGPTVDEVFSMLDIPYEDGTIAEILSEHSLEHVPFQLAEDALKEWFRVLQPGGKLNLFMPDFEVCCQRYLEAPLESPNFFQTRAWYKATIYGIQKSQAGEPDDAQVHKCGFSKEEIRIVLTRNGFQIESVENYGGPNQKPDYGTPSYAVVATKPGVSKMKIGWVGVPNMEAAQTRIRVHRVSDWLKSKGYWSQIVDYPDIVNDNYDVAIVGKGFDENHLKLTKWLKKEGKTVYADLCEDLIDWPYVNEILELCDKVICCSRVLAEKVQSINPNTLVIEDAWEI